MNREEKARTVEELQARLVRAKVALLADFRGLSVAQMNDLRRQCQNARMELQVVKNTLARRAARATDLEALEAGLDGPTAIVLDYGDPAAAARVLTRFIAHEKRIRFKSAVMEGKPITLQEMGILAELPPLDGMRALLAGLMVAAPRRFLGVLGGVHRKLLGLLDAYGRKLDRPEEPAPVEGE